MKQNNFLSKFLFLFLALLVFVPFSSVYAGSPGPGSVTVNVPSTFTGTGTVNVKVQGTYVDANGVTQTINTTIPLTINAGCPAVSVDNGVINGANAVDNEHSDVWTIDTVIVMRGTFSPTDVVKVDGSTMSLQYDDNGLQINASIPSLTVGNHTVLITNSCGNSNSYTINVTVKPPTTYTVTATAGAGGTISPSSRTVNYNSTTTFTVTPNSGYYISTVTGCSGSGSTTYTTGAITANCAVAASFAASPVVSGTLTPTSSACTIAEGANSCTKTLTWTTINSIWISAVTSASGTPSPGISANNGSQTFTVPRGNIYFFLYNNNVLLAQSNVVADCALGSDFVSGVCRAKPIITATQASNGTITPAGATSVVYGSGQSYTITPNSGYNVGSLIIDGSSIAAATSKLFSNVTTNHTISATFTASSCANGANNPPTCTTCSAGSAMVAGNCTPVTVTVSATTPYSTTPSTNVSFTYIPATNSGATECKLLDNNRADLTTTYKASSPIIYASPNGVGTYNYYVQCRNTTTTSATNISNLITVTTACASGTGWNGSSCVAFFTCQSPVGLSPTGSVAATGGNVNLTWQAVPNVTSYNLRMSNNATGSSYDDPRFPGTCGPYYCEDGIVASTYCSAGTCTVPNVPVVLGNYSFWIDPQYPAPGASSYCNGSTTFSVVPITPMTCSLAVDHNPAYANNIDTWVWTGASNPSGYVTTGHGTNNGVDVGSFTYGSTNFTSPSGPIAPGNESTRIRWYTILDPNTGALLCTSNVVTFIISPAAPTLPILTTTSPVTNITQTTATGGGNVTSNGGATVTVSGIAWSTSVNPTTANSKTTDGWAIGGPWTSGMTGLTASALYHVRAYATNSVGTSYGADVQFTTSAAPVVINGSCSSTHYNCNAGTSANNAESSPNWTWNCVGSGTGHTDAPCSETIPLPTNLVASCPAPGTTANLSWTLPAGYTLSYFRIVDNTTNTNPPYFITENVTDTGPATSFPTIPGHNYTAWIHTRLPSGSSSNLIATGFSCIPASLPTVTTTTPVINITQTTATGGGNVTSNGGATVTVSGIAWSTSVNPTTANSKTTDGWAIGGPWTSGMTGLTASALYHVRAYATNSVGTSYGADVQFTTSAVAIPAIDAQCVSPITAPASVTVGQTFSATVVMKNTGSETWQLVSDIPPPVGYYFLGSQSPQDNTNWVTARAAVTTPAPPTTVTTGNNATFTFNATAPTTPGTYAFDWQMLKKGLQWVPTPNSPESAVCRKNITVNPPSLPTVTTTTPVINITQTTATGGGNVTSNGGATVTVSGIAWSTSVNPTTANSKTTDGWAIGGPWTSGMTGLTASALYHVRAYATNSVGTSYGADVQFTTSAVAIPAIDAQCVSPITAPASVTVGQTFSATVTMKNTGTNTWSEASLYRLGSQNTQDNTRWSFGRVYLPAGVTVVKDSNYSFVFNAIAPTNMSTAGCTDLGGGNYSCPFDWRIVHDGDNWYGSTCTKTITVNPPSLPTITTTTPVTNITQTTATGGGNVTSNGGATVTVSGIAWSTSVNPTTANSKTTDGWAIGGPWTSGMTGLTASALYHVRAYATNSVGTSYGADVQFTTSAIPTYVLTLTKAGTGAGTVTSNVGGINCGATCSASYSSGTSVILTATPTTGTFTGWSGAGCNGTGTCTVSMSSTQTVTATFTFTATTPTITTTSTISNITQTTATGGGNVTSNGGATVTVSGLVWSTSVNPTYAGGGPGPGQTTDGWALGGPWTSGMTGLTTSTLYHVRAYATNSVGTAYGNDVTFTTAGPAPVNGVLGCANGHAFSNGTTATDYSSCPQCSQGNPSNGGAFPAAGGTANWQCLGSGIGHTDSPVGSATQDAPPASLYINANPTTIAPGASTTLTWNNGSGTCTASASPTSASWSGAKATSGSISVSPTSTTTYTITCGNGTALVKINVRTQPIFIEN